MSSPHPKGKPVLLVILDGFGWREKTRANAIAAAKPPFWNHLLATCPHTTLACGGLEVGLPEGQFGNSEVGHLNLGAGRVVYQDIARIDHEIKTGAFFKNPALLGAIKAVGARGKIHLMGLVSDGGVHSMDRHYLALLELLKRERVNGERVCFHVITDGRDTLPTSAAGYVARLRDEIERTGMGRIASVSGRYYAMDRDTNWERTKRYYRCITLGEDEIAPDAIEAIEASYRAKVTDEFILPHFIVEHGRPLGRIENGDSVIWFNFRADRARQMCRALTEGDEFDKACFVRGARPSISLTTMTSYLSGLQANVAYQAQRLDRVLGEVLSQRGYAQFRCAETEKYAHVTYFFNGGAETPFAGEERKLIPSPKVATYDLQPEMSLPAVVGEVVTALESGRFAFVLSNFANGDMVGHTGIFDAAVKAVGALDAALARVVEAAREAGYEILLTADHGNCEEMADERGNTLTNHSYNPVPLVLASRGRAAAKLRDGGALCDVAPTVLALMGEEQPVEMTGKSLLV